jgi:hypothetical protein
MDRSLGGLHSSFTAFSWLQLLLQERLQQGLILQFNTSQARWELRCPGSRASIALPLIPALYHLGPQPDLPCAQWTPASEGFSALDLQLPAPGLVENPQPLVQATPDGFQLGYDILGLTYWMLARCEEVNPPAELLDNHGRFPATSSHALRHDYLQRPIVDEWLGVLRQLVQRLWPSLPLQQHEFRIVVSHDVDAPSAYGFGRKRTVLRGIAARLLKHHDVAWALMAPRIRLASRRQLHPADPFNTFELLMDQSEAAGIRSAFYFICGRTDPRLDAQYEPEHPAIRALMRHIHQRGHEIGLHPSYNTCHSPSTIATEAARLQRIATEEGIQQPEWGGRMHFLRWQWPTTAHGWEQAGFHYDSTLGYADRPGFRCGTCHAYPMFDPVAQRQLQLIQRPLIVMECSVIAERYLGLGYGPAALALIQQLQQRCRAVGGQFTLLWHNSHFTREEDWELYRQVVVG